MNPPPGSKDLLATTAGDPDAACTGTDGVVLATYNRFYPPPSAVAPKPLLFNPLIDDVLRTGSLLIGEQHFCPEHLENESHIVAALLRRKARSRPLSVVLEPAMNVPKALAESDAPYSVGLAWPPDEICILHFENGLDQKIPQDNHSAAHAMSARRAAEPDGLVVCILGRAHLLGMRSTQFFCLKEGFAPMVLVQGHGRGTIRVSPWMGYVDGALDA